jgi:hypothetical protein
MTNPGKYVPCKFTIFEPHFTAVQFLRLLLLLIILPSWYPAVAQTTSASGRVIDAETKAALPFVNIVIEGQNKGVTTDIDGKFTIRSNAPFAAINISYLGYEPVKYTFGSDPSSIIIKLKKSIISLSEVEVLPGENPAHRIIKKVIANRDLNDPERLHSFTYASSDTINSLDTLKKGLSKMLKKQHLFLSESVTERKYLEGRSSELVIASRVSGLKESPFAFLATQMQSFSFYKDMIMVLDKSYLGPVSDGSYNKYLFIIEDTLYQGSDSVYVISFRPRKGKTFDALKGTLYINTNGYALQNVIAEPVDNSGLLAGKIQQRYEFINGKQWFPVQLNTDWFYNIFSLNDSSVTASARGASKTFDPNNKLKVVSRSYIRDIVIAPELKKKDIGDAEVEIAPNASSRPEEFWKKYRIDSLSERELTTYQVVDSIGKAAKLDLKMKTYEALAFGKYPIGKLDLDLNRVYTHNEYEGDRAGLGLHTSDRLVKWVAVGGYGAYGFRDKAFKYGSDVTFTLDQRSEVKLTGRYSNDVVEAGGVSFAGDKLLVNPESFRYYLLRVMDKIEKKEAGLSFHAPRYWMFNFSFNTQERAAANGYQFGIPSENTILYDKFSFTEASFGFRFAYREKFLQTPRYKTSLGSDHPIVYAQVTKGLKDVAGGAFDYMRYDMRVESSFLIREYGKTTLQLNAGLVSGDVPYSILYNGKGSYERYALMYGNTSFGTMRMNEFLSDRYASLFFSHDLGSILFHSEKFRPGLVLISNIGFGTLQHPYHHFNIPIRTMEKGYFESGLLINNLLRSELLGVGVGALYRYGPYALEETKENIAVKFTFSVNF